MSVEGEEVKKTLLWTIQDSQLASKETAEVSVQYHKAYSHTPNATHMDYKKNPLVMSTATDW